MYIKLNFTADKPIGYVFRAVNEIINNSAITSIATLTSNSTTWHSSILSNLDTANSEIIRTGTGTTALTTSLTKSHFSKIGTNGYADGWEWTVEFSVYDNTSTKYYVQHASPENSTAFTAKVGTVSSAAINSTQYPVTVDPTNTTTTGTSLSLTGYALSGAQYSSSSTGSLVRTFIMYITDKCMIFATSNTATNNVGFGNTYSNSNYYNGPWIFSQYTRFDYHNTNANGIVPMMFTNISRAAGAGFGQSANDWDNVDNVMATAQTSQTMRVLNLVSAHPQAGASWPIITTPTVNWGCASRFNDEGALTTTTATSATVYAGVTYGAALYKTVSTRFVSADLKTQAFGMLPMTWRHLYYYNNGGDASAQGGFYVFNGDYYPGDEFTYSTKTYKILPTWTGYSNRIGIAIPKE